MSNIRSLGLNKEEELILAEAPEPAGMGFYDAERLLYEFINREQYKNFFKDCLVTSNARCVVVQRIKRTYKTNKGI